MDKVHQRTGTAQFFLLACLSKIVATLKQKNIFFSNQELKKCFLEVRVSNFTAIAFYKKCGFAQISTRKAYYEDNKEDAVVMLKYL